MKKEILILCIFTCACSQQDQSVTVDTTSESTEIIEVSQPDERPNILLIVADDLGYTDIGSYGGEIETPNLDALAENGIRFSRFYTSTTCAPTRAMLLTGLDNHVAGIGSQGNAENQNGQPGYEGVLNQRVVTIAELLRDAGYHTYMSGKWQLGMEQNEIPSSRGFEQTFALMEGGGSYFNDMLNPIGTAKANYFKNGKKIESFPDDFYATHYYTDNIIEQINSNLVDGQPFFAYLAYTTPHFPLHAPEDTIDKYQGVYDEGFNTLKQKRFESLMTTGLLPAGTAIPGPNPESDNWDDLSEDEQQRSARLMEIYAAMVDDLDQEIGRVMANLKEKGVYDNTLIIFMSDNGADPTSDRVGLTQFYRLSLRHNNSLENMGRQGSHLFYGHNWAESSMAAFKRYKSEAAEGGIRVPAIISWPGKIQGSHITHGIAGVMDILPTALEVVGISHPGTLYKGREVAMPMGQSLAPMLTEPDMLIRDADEYIGMEHWSSRAIIQQDWKLLGLYDGRTGLQDWGVVSHQQGPRRTE